MRRKARAFVCVLGSINLDIVVRVPRFPCCGETLIASDVLRNMGGKGANQAVAAVRAGAKVRMIGAVGDDADGRMLVSMLKQEGIDCDAIHVSDRCPTGIAYITVDGVGENQIIVYPGANALAGAGAPVDAHVLLAQLESPLDAVATFFTHRKPGSVAILNAAPFRREALPLFSGADIIVVNEIELASYCGEENPPQSPQDAADMAAGLLSGDEQHIVVTLGKEGSVTASYSGISFMPGSDAAVVDTTGAGDCFCGFLAAGMAAGRPLATSITDAHRAASISVGRAGAACSMPFFAELTTLDSPQN